MGCPISRRQIPNRPDYCMERLSPPVYRGGRTQTLESGVPSSMPSICPTSRVPMSARLLFHEIGTIKPLQLLEEAKGMAYVNHFLTTLLEPILGFNLQSTPLKLWQLPLTYQASEDTQRVQTQSLVTCKAHLDLSTVRSCA